MKGRIVGGDDRFYQKFWVELTLLDFNWYSLVTVQP